MGLGQVVVVDDKFNAGQQCQPQTAERVQQVNTGIAFVLPVESVVGLESQLERFKQEVREQYF